MCYSTSQRSDQNVDQSFSEDGSMWTTRVLQRVQGGIYSTLSGSFYSWKNLLSGGQQWCRCFETTSNISCYSLADISTDISVISYHWPIYLPWRFIGQAILCFSVCPTFHDSNEMCDANLMMAYVCIFLSRA